MSDQEIIDQVKFVLSNWDLGDIKFASSSKAKVGAFILASCFIDHLACFYFNKEGTPKTYKDFVQIFLPQYNADDLYHSLRCKLVHNYTEGGKYSFIHEKPEFHLKTDRQGRTVINLEDFIDEIISVKVKFFSLLDSENSECRKNTIARFKKVGILGPGQLEIMSDKQNIKND